MTQRQRYAALRFAGLDEERAELEARQDWIDLTGEAKILLLRSWNMGSAGHTTRRFKGDTTRMMPVMRNPAPDWVTDEAKFAMTVGVPFGEFRRMWRALPKSKQHQFHSKMRGGNWMPSAFQWVVAQFEPSVKVNKRGASMRRCDMNMVRKTTGKVVTAFLAHRAAKAGTVAGKTRYVTDGKRLLLWGNLVAEHVEDGIRLYDAGWKTKTTKGVLNAILETLGIGSRITQKKFSWYLGGKPWTGTVLLGRISMEPSGGFRVPPSGYNPGRKRNPLTRKETASEIREIRKAEQIGKAFLPGHTRSFESGYGHGVAGVLYRKGPRSARRSVELAAASLPNGLKCLKNLHTARERAYAKRLITRYYLAGIDALKKGNKERAAHAYGALAAIKRLARFELPHAQVVSNLASFRMDALRYQVKVVKGGRSWRYS